MKLIKRDNAQLKLTIAPIETYWWYVFAVSCIACKDAHLAYEVLAY